jgi:hypothetical protein
MAQFVNLPSRLLFVTGYAVAGMPSLSWQDVEYLSARRDHEKDPAKAIQSLYQ